MIESAEIADAMKKSMSSRGRKRNDWIKHYVPRYTTLFRRLYTLNVQHICTVNMLSIQRHYTIYDKSKMPSKPAVILNIIRDNIENFHPNMVIRL